MQAYSNSLVRCLVLLLLGTSCCVMTSFAVESTTYAPDPVDWSGSDVRYEATSQQQANEKAFNSMAGVGARPSKAERARMEQKNAQSAAAVPAVGKPMTAMDLQFMQLATMDGIKEMHMGQMAVQQGQSDAIKQLGRKIVADHTKANDQLTRIAAKRGMKANFRHQMGTMSKRDLKNFDQAWLSMMVNDHQKGIAAYERQAKMGVDPELKAFARKTLPVLQTHLKMVKAAQGKIVAMQN